MSSNPRRTPVTRPDTRSLTLKTNMVLRKGATFHSPTTPPASPEIEFRPPPLPRRSQTNLDDVIDSHRRRVALALDDIDRCLTVKEPASPTSPKTFRDNSLPIPRGVLNHTLDSSIMGKEPEVERRVLRPRTRRTSRHHESDSGLGTSIVSSIEKTVKTSAVTRSAAARATTITSPKTLSTRSTNRILEHTLKPLLAKPAFKDFHPLVLECPKKIQEREIVCLRDVEKTLLLLAPERTEAAELYLDFCLTTIRCVQATVDSIPPREQTRERDLPYTSGYFIDLIDQIHHYAQQLADARENGGKAENMDVDPYVPAMCPDVAASTNKASRTDEIKLHGGIHVNGRPAELVRVKKNGKAISMATGEPVEIEEEGDGLVRFKRSASQELEDEEEIMRSMARRKKNATPEELAPKKCREPGCNKEFKRPCDLTKHEKTHSRPWKCPVPTCKYHEYGWPTEKEMDRHHNDKHSSAPPMYECLYKPCPYKSKRESNCKQHMEKAHGWTYVRTKTNGKKPGAASSISGQSAQPTPQLQNLPTPSSEHSMGVATPPDDWSRVYASNLDFPTYTPELDFGAIPQEITIDYSPIDNATPSTDASGMDHNSAYQDLGNDFAMYDDIYSAHAQLPTPVHDVYSKNLAQQLAAFSAPELYQAQPAHLSPIGQGNAMLFTPQSLNDVDEGFDEHQDYSGFSDGSNGADFILFPGNRATKPMFNDSLFEVPSMAAGYSQPSSQDLLNAFNLPMDWNPHDMNQFLPH
ncbi:zinc finger transcription factor ace1 [Rhypophila decipiens]